MLDGGLGKRAGFLPVDRGAGFTGGQASRQERGHAHDRDEHRDAENHDVETAAAQPGPAGRRETRDRMPCNHFRVGCWLR